MSKYSGKPESSPVKPSKACDICGGYLCRPYGNPGKLPYPVVQCIDCSLVYSDVLLLPEEYIEAVSKDPLVVRDPQILKVREHLRIQAILSEVASFRKGGRLLDIGCGHGFLLSEAKQMGYETYGVEIMNSSAAYGIEAGFHIHIGDIFSAEFPDDSFDVVVMSQVLEHMMAPKESLTEARRVLRKGGIMYIVVPNVESRNAIRLPDWWSEYHLYHFSVSSLRKLIDAAGLLLINDIVNPHVLDIGLLREWLYRWGIAKIARRFVASSLGKWVQRRFPSGSITMICRKAGGSSDLQTDYSHHR